MTMKLGLHKPENRLLFSLLVVDALFIFFHILKYSTGYVSSYLFDIDQNKGYAEIYQSIKELWIVMILFYFALKRRKAIYWAWIIIFSVLLLNDVMIYHENIAGNLSDYLFSAHELRKVREKLGEIVVYAAIGFPLLLFMRAVHSRADQDDKDISGKLTRLFIILMIFVVFVDLVYFGVQLFVDWDVLLYGLVAIEEAGEMIMISIIYGFLFSLSLKYDARQ